MKDELKNDLAEARRINAKLTELAVDLKAAEEAHRADMDAARVAASPLRDPWPVMRPAIERGQAAIADLRERIRFADGMVLIDLTPPAPTKVDQCQWEITESLQALGTRLVRMKQRARERLERAERAFWLAVADELSSRITPEARALFVAVSIAHDRAEAAGGGEVSLDDTVTREAAAAALALVDGFEAAA